MTDKPMMIALFVVILAVRFILAVSAARGSRSARSPIVSAGVRRFVKFTVTWLIALPALTWAAFAAAPPRMSAMPYVPGLVLIISAVLPLIARHVLAPLGLVRASYYVAIFGWTLADERQDQALHTAAAALGHKGDFDPEAAAWIEEKIRIQPVLRGAAIAAAASIAAARGDTEGALVLFRSVRTLDVRACDKASRHTAAAWLCAEAAERGAWDEAIEIGADSDVGGRAAALLASVGMRLLGRPGAPGRTRLVMQWILAPRTFQMFPIVERALSVPDGAAPAEEDDDTARPSISEPEGDPLASAIAAHARVLGEKKPSPAEIARVGRAFDAALADEALADHVAQRGAELGAMRSAEVIGRIRANVEDSIFCLLKDHRIALDDTVDDLGQIAAGAQRRLRDETLTVIEALSDAVRSRVREKRALTPMDEWREWSALRMAYDRGVLLGGPELRYLAFTKVHSDVCALAVWLFNDRKERPIANAMFRFLLAEANATGDTEGIALQSKNVACGV